MGAFYFETFAFAGALHYYFSFVVVAAEELGVPIIVRFEFVVNI